MPSLKKEPPGPLAARTIPSLVARGFPQRAGMFRLPCRLNRGNTHCRSSRLVEQIRQLGEVRRHAVRARF
jgi:hypothetical protein